MNRKDIYEIIECLPKGRTIYPYHKDRYAAQLLEYDVGDEKRVADIRSGRFGKLLDRPAIKSIISRCGNGWLTRDDLNAAWSNDSLDYLLALDKWGPVRNDEWDQAWYQTSRPGQNLVLQLNFSNAHNSAYNRILKCEDKTIFNCTAHPVKLEDGHTLAWARLDLDLDKGEALIEEIQSDWAENSDLARRKALRALKSSAGKHKNVRIEYSGARFEAGSMCRYFDHIAAPHIRQWDEAMLSATLWFLIEEIGLRKIFLHDFETGCRLKGIKDEKPPKSIYTKLPTKFCFEKTDVAPELLHSRPGRRFKKVARDNDLKFWQLEI